MRHLEEQEMLRKAAEEEDKKRKDMIKSEPDLLQVLFQARVKLYKVIQEKLKNLKEFPEGFSCASKLTAEEKVENIIEGLKNPQVAKLGKLLRSERN